MKIAVIGAGHWGMNLVRNLNDLDVLTHVVEQKTETIDNISSGFPEVQCLDNYELLLESNIDAVVIATPAHSHYEIALAFLKAGKDVFIEKPMTLCSKEAKELVDAAQLGDVILMVGHMLLYQPAIQFIVIPKSGSYWSNIPPSSGTLKIGSRKIKRKCCIEFGDS